MDPAIWLGLGLFVVIGLTYYCIVKKKRVWTVVLMILLICGIVLSLSLWMTSMYR